MTAMKLLAATILLTLAASLAEAGERPACVGRELLDRAIAARLPGSRVTTIEGADAELVLAAFNRIPPETGLAAETVVIVDAERSLPYLRIALFENGCLARAGTVARAAVEQALTALARAGA
jgi:fructose-specific component phosphotransferase system IIB-like protein